MKKQIATINRPRPSDFGIVEKVGKHCYFDDGVFVYNSGEGHCYFECELPLCRNGDRIEVGSLYNTSDGVVKVISMKLSNGVNQCFDYEVFDDDSDILELLSWDFKSIFW